MTSVAFIINVITTLVCVGQVWFLQVVHYPLFRNIGPEKFPEYYSTLRMKMTLFNLPLVVLETSTSVMVFLFFSMQPKPTPAMENSFMLYGISVFLLLPVHLFTYRGVQPALKKLSTQFSDKNLASLLQWNLMRSIAWTVRLGLILSTMFTVQ